MKGVGGLRQTHHQWEVLAAVVVVVVVVLGEERQAHCWWEVLGDDGDSSIVSGRSWYGSVQNSKLGAYLSCL